MTYYNTTNTTGDDLAVARQEVKTQEQIIEGLFDGRKPLSPSQALFLATVQGHEWPITSVRRAISNLTARGKLQKSDIQVSGPYKKPEYLWRAV